MMSPACPPGFVRHRLKAATADHHDTLDSGFAALDLKNHNDYRRFLAIQAAVLGPLEGWLTQHGLADLLPDWPQRRRYMALQADLAGLGTPAISDPRAAGIDSPTSPRLLGIAYVLEGSRLGAQYLARDAAASRDPVVHGNMRFLTHGMGRRLWPTFLDVLESRVDAATADAAAQAARQTFDLFLAAQQAHAPAPAEASA